MAEPVKVISRKSELALAQTHHINDKVAALKYAPEIVALETLGDKVLEKSLTKIGGKALFTKELEDKLENGEADYAVHSLKDLPTDLPENLTVAAIFDRRYPFDVMVFSRKHAPPTTPIQSFADVVAYLPNQAVIGTSSPRRMTQLKALQPSWRVESIRGNVNSRLAKCDDPKGVYDAIVLAEAGLQRLHFGDRISFSLSPPLMIPAVGQGFLAIEMNQKNRHFTTISSLNDRDASQCAQCERTFLHTLGGGCAVPVGAYASIEGDTMTLTAVIGSPSGEKNLRKTISGERTTYIEMGKKMAEMMIAEGAKVLLDESRAYFS